MPKLKVTLSRTYSDVFYVDGTEDDARALADDYDTSDLYEEEEYFYTTEVNEIPEGEPFWTGGSKGNWYIAE